MASERLTVGQVSDFAEGTMTPIEVSGRELLIVRQNGRFYALPDRCTHARYPLHDGELLEGKVKCHYHGATFDLQSGRPTLPAVKPIACYRVIVEDETVYVDLSAD